MFSISLPNTAGGESPPRPVAGLQGDSKTIHVAHFIALLQTAITNHYSPLNKKIDDKDRDQFSKLRVELEYYASLQEQGGNDRARAASSSGSDDHRMSRLSLNSGNGSPKSPSLSIPPVPALPTAYLGSPQSNRTAGATPSSPPFGLFNPAGMSRVVSHSSTTTGSGRSASGVGFSETPGVDLVDVVRRMWGIEGPRLRSDLDGLKRAGLDERVGKDQYLTEHRLMVLSPRLTYPI